LADLRVIDRKIFRTQLERSLAQCDGGEGGRCPSVLAGPDHPDLCQGCVAAFALAGIRSNEQLTLEDEAA
jgi:hypothetical protein